MAILTPRSSAFYTGGEEEKQCPVRGPSLPVNWQTRQGAREAEKAATAEDSLRTTTNRTWAARGALKARNA